MKCSRCKGREAEDGKKKCKPCSDYWFKYYEDNREACIERAKFHINKDRNKTNANKKKWFRKNHVSAMRTAAKVRAKKYGVDFNLEPSDIITPEFCPVLGIPLFIGDGKSTANSPSLDRIIPSVGYTKGNVRVISHKANTIKSNATAEELKLVYEYLFKEELLRK
jgi:hypothetical protein